MSTNISFATIIATLTPKDSTFKPIQYKADSTFDEETILSEPQPAKERGRRFMSNDGNQSQVIQRYASNGKRDLSVFDDTVADLMKGWAQRNPTVYFDFSFRYIREAQSVQTVRVQVHSDCFFENTPAREISNDIAIIKFTINYAKLTITDANGVPL